MTEATKRGAREGIQFGLIAGIVFAVVEMIATAAMGNSPMMPFRLFASVAIGETALLVETAGTTFVIGSIVHLLLSAIFGYVYGIVGARSSTELQTEWRWQLLIGPAYGSLLWLVNFQLIARMFYPWFLDTPQLMQLVLHAAFYGLPLAVMYASSERRAHHLPRAPSAV